MGGTIGSVKTADGAKPGLSFSDLLDSFSKASNCEEATWLNELLIGDVLTPLGAHGVHSSNIRVPHVQLLIRTVIDNYDHFDAFVITHGTDTMAFTAGMLGFGLRNVKKPVIITGSQKLPEEAGSDAMSNLADAFAAAASGIGGVWLVFNGLVLNAARVSKADTQSLDAFVSVSRDEKTINEFLAASNPATEQEIFSSDFSSEVDIFYRRSLTQFCFSEPGLHLSVLTLSHFPVNEQPEPFFKRKLLNVRRPELFLQGGRHTGKSQGFKFVDSLVC